MTAHSGALVLIKIGNGGSPETFATIGGLRISELRIDNQILITNTVQSSQWRQGMTNAGMSSVTISGSGIFTDSASEETLRGYVFNNSANNYQFVFANGHMFSGAFQISEYQRSGDVAGAEMYMITLQSAGDIAYA